ncbi:hypothetical protein AGMMS49991_07040 [Spirochaetia bacterium]|nr:hypothetical protein AGMMS49991_07040 [Spirochaetia bacterium]
MRKITLFLLAAVVAVSTMFIGCDLNGGGDKFTASTKEITNDVATLGLVGTSASSSNTNAATAVIDSGKVKITSVAEGSSTVIVTDGTNNATIAVVVSETGAISETITKYQVVANVIGVQTGNKVALSCDTDGATIYYTIDGTLPTSGSSLYSAPVVVKTGTNVKAIAVKTGWNNSGVFSESFTAVYNWMTIHSSDTETRIGDVALFDGTEEITFSDFIGEFPPGLTGPEPKVYEDGVLTFTLYWQE